PKYANTIAIYETRTLTEVRTLNGHHDHLTGLAFSPDGARLASTGWDRTVRVWEVGTGRELLAHRGHTGLVWCVGFGPGGRTLIWASKDRTVRIWDPKVRQEFAESRVVLEATRAERYGPVGKSQEASPAGSGVVVSDLRKFTPMVKGLMTTEVSPGIQLAD